MTIVPIDSAQNERNPPNDTTHRWTEVQFPVTSLRIPSLQRTID